jgi:hypothetical protein
MTHHAAFTQFFSELDDPRQAEKIAYPFFDVVFLTVCAAIGGAQGWEDIELFGEAHLEWFQRNGLFPNGLPVHDTIARIVDQRAKMTRFPGFSASNFDHPGVCATIRFLDRSTWGVNYGNRAQNTAYASGGRGVH